MTKVIDADKTPVSILILNEKDWNEFYQVGLPADLNGKKREEAERRLISSGFQPMYRFDRRIIDRRSMSLAKAQATSITNRILEKTGLEMVIGHGIETAVEVE